MKRSMPLAVLASAMMAGLVVAAELRMSWRDQPDGDERLIEMEVGQEAVIDIWLTMSEGDTFSTLVLVNEAAETIVQAATTVLVNDQIGWSDGSVQGTSLGTGGQQIVFGADLADFVIAGPGEVLVGSQTIRLIDGDSGEETEITFALDGLSVLDAAGAAFGRTSTGSPSADEVGFYHIGSGSPGYGGPAGQDVREPLVVRVVTDGGDPGNANDNTNDNGSGVIDTDEDGVPDDVDAFPDDPGETTDTDADGVGDNADADDDDDGTPDEEDDFPQDADEVTDTDGDGLGDNADPDDDADGVSDEDDPTPLGEENGGGQPTSGGGSVTRGPCGFGMVSALPLGLVGLFLLQRGRSRRCRRPRPNL